MRVNTITCHDVYNVGAALQAYALCRYLRERGHDAHIIDYKPDYLSGHYRLWGGVSPRFDRPGLRLAFNLAKFPGRAAARMGRRRRNFDSFRRTYLPLTARYARSRRLRMCALRAVTRYGTRCSRTGATLPSTCSLRRRA